MKKLLFIISIALLLLAVSCRTTVGVEYAVPAEIDMGSYRTVAVASCVPLKGLKTPRTYIRGLDIEADMGTAVRSALNGPRYSKESAEYATEVFERALVETGFFNVITHEIADRIVERARDGEDVSAMIERYGIDAILIPKMTSTSIDEAIGSDVYTRKDYAHRDENGNPKLIEEIRFTLYQEVSVGLSYTIIDANTMSIYAVKNIADSMRRESRFYSHGIYARDPIFIAEKILDSFALQIERTLAPHQKRESLSLMKNRPKNYFAKDAYELCEKGYSERALELFLSCYRESGHIPSAYNAGLIMYSLGRCDEAISFLEDVYSTSADSQIYNLLERLKQMSNLTERAQKQLEGYTSTDRKDTGMNIFEVVMSN